MLRVITKIRGIERFAVPTDHPAYNSSVGLLLDDSDGSLKKDIEKCLPYEGGVVVVLGMNDRLRKAFDLIEKLEAQHD